MSSPPCCWKKTRDNTGVYPGEASCFQSKIAGCSRRCHTLSEDSADDLIERRILSNEI